MVAGLSREFTLAEARLSATRSIEFLERPDLTNRCRHLGEQKTWVRFEEVRHEVNKQREQATE